ncbi:MAG: hypothetical protein K0S54_2394 [Alphaproteobacteria bacterium]|jgi:uncharacterized protein YgiB involved in biofilm formation|nr:hypothetical protein [Alphaproteobacteria bacterium]
MNPRIDEKDERSSRRTKYIVLTIVGAGLGLVAYNAFSPDTPDTTTETRNVYKSREDCIAATGDAAKCEPSNGRGGYSSGHYFGPIFFPGSFSGFDRQPASPAAGARPAPAPVGQFTSQRGGFGGSSGGYSSGA